MSDFQMNPADVQEASVLMSRLADRMSYLELTKSDDSFDCGDTAVQEALAYFVSMYNKRGQTTRTWLNGCSDSLHATAQASADTDDEAAEFFAALRAKL